MRLVRRLVTVLVTPAAAIAIVEWRRRSPRHGFQEQTSTAEVPDPEATIADAIRGVVDDGADARVIGPGDASRFHRAGCRIIGSSAATEISRADALRQGRSACEACTA